MTTPAPREIPLLVSEYPARLRRLSRAPEPLHVVGRVPDGAGRSVAIVGSRAASGRACDVARQAAHALAARGFDVVSGGAFGIDAAAHDGALSAPGGLTFAVLGCGIDVVYPDRHAALFGRIALAGGLLSEYAPGTPPRAGQFPARNRIIAALADAVIVVEAAARSGALITARQARALGVPVLAAAGSPGTDRLLRAGLARPLPAGSGELEGAIAAARAGGPMPDAVPEDPPASTDVAAVVAAVARAGATGITPEALSIALAWPLPRIMTALTEAELDGWAFRTQGNRFEVSRGQH